MSNPFGPGVYLLSAKMVPGDIIENNVQVFLPVREQDHLGRTWTQFRLIDKFHFKQGVERYVRVSFVDPEVEDQQYDLSQPIDVLMPTVETGQVIAGLLSDS